MNRELVALMDGREIGRVHMGPRGRLSFVYDDAWRAAAEAFPLSLSMPIAAAEHGPQSIEAFLWGLLPDNEMVLQRWARKFQVSSRNVFALLSHVGEDCAGAVQFVPPERIEGFDAGNEDRVDWLDEEAVAERLRQLRQDHAAWRLPQDAGQFSLAGAQPKTALHFADGRWGVPSGRAPTTHILKPPTGRYDGHAENEHICLDLARALGLAAATSEVRRFGDEIAIVVERYDRVRVGERFVRVHQEDMCQALGVAPARKYQNEGGPGVAEVVELLRVQSSAREEDVGAFIDAVAFNWLIAGTDAHAKNYSLLLASGPRVRLAPLYDLASILPYDEINLQKAKLAMKLGGDYRLRHVGLSEWRNLAREVRFDPDRLVSRVIDIAARIPDEVSAACARGRASGLDQGILERLADRVANWAKERGNMLSELGRAGNG